MFRTVILIYMSQDSLACLIISQRLCYVLTHEEDSERLGGSFDESTKA